MLFSVDLNLESLFRNVFSSPVNTAQPRLNCLEMLPWQPAAAVVWVWLRSPVQVTSYTCVAPDFAMRHATLYCHKIGEEWKKVWLMMYCRKNFNNFTVKFSLFVRHMQTQGTEDLLFPYCCFDVCRAELLLPHMYTNQVCLPLCIMRCEWLLSDDLQALGSTYVCLRNSCCLCSYLTWINST